VQSIASKPKRSRAAAGAEARRIAEGVGALLRHTLSFGRGSDYLSVIEESGLTLTQLKTLLFLSGGPEESLPVKRISEDLGITPSAATRAVDALFERGFVNRSEDSEDRRVRRIAITEGGRALVETITSRRMAGLEAFAAGLNATQRRKLATAFEALMENDDFAAAYRANQRGVRR
jgi:DNA-binding MarR family transcriptional regulator